VHGQVGAAFFEGHFEFLDEQALATHLGQRAVEDLVATGGHAQHRNGALEPGLEQVANVFGLPQGQAAFTGGDHPRRRGLVKCSHPAMLSAPAQTGARG
jgi:hypothetical protein